MGVLSAIGGIVSGIAKPVTNVLNKKTERKMARESAKAKIELNKQSGQQTLELTDAEAEALRWKGEGDSWKDEFVTILIPGTVFGGTAAGAVAYAYGHPNLLEGLLRAYSELSALGVDVGFLCEAVVLAAIGLKIWRRS